MLFVLLHFVPVVSAGLAVAGLAQAQVGVAAPVMSQPGIATPTVYSISNTQWLYACFKVMATVSAKMLKVSPNGVILI